MIKKFFPLLILSLFVFTACSSPPNNNVETTQPARGSNASPNQDAEPEVSLEPLPSLIRTLEIDRHGLQVAVAAEIEWQLIGTVEIEIPLDTLSFAQSPPHLAKITFGEVELQEGKIPFNSTGEGQGSWQFISGDCTGGGQFGLIYEVFGQMDPDTGAIELNLIEKWTGGSSTATCNGVGGSSEIPPGEITLSPVKLGICKTEDSQKENTWVQHPEAGGGITWTDKFKLEDKYEREADRVADQVMRFCETQEP